MTEAKKGPVQQKLFQAQTTWFHVFNAMVGNGDVAKMGPHAVTVYLVIKSYANFKTGKAFPGIDTVVTKSGISRAQVMRSLAVLAEYGYLDKEKVGRKNTYTLREKIQVNDKDGSPTAMATWDYLPSAVETAREELKGLIASGDLKGQTVTINFNIQMIGQAETVNQQNLNDSSAQRDLPPEIAESLRKLREKMGENREKERNNKDKHE